MRILVEVSSEAEQCVSVITTLATSNHDDARYQVGRHLPSQDKSVRYCRRAALSDSRILIPRNDGRKVGVNFASCGPRRPFCMRQESRDCSAQLPLKKWGNIFAGRVNTRVVDETDGDDDGRKCFAMNCLI